MNSKNFEEFKAYEKAAQQEGRPIDPEEAAAAERALYWDIKHDGDPNYLRNPVSPKAIIDSVPVIKSPLDEQVIRQNIYEAQGLAGPSLDFYRARGGNYPEVFSESEEAKNIYDQVAKIIDTNQYPMLGSHPQDVIDIVNILAQENHWKSYKDVDIDLIKKELQARGIPIKL